MGRLLRPVEVSETIGLGRTAAYALLRQGAIPCVHIGKAVRVHSDDLESWMNERREAGREEREAVLA